MLNKKELISAFQELADEHLIPGKREDDERRVYWIIIDDVRIENLNKFIKKHFIETERSAGWTFKQVTSNYIDASSYFTNHELSLMFYTCFSYKTVYYIQYKDKSTTIDYWDSKPKFNSYNINYDNKYLIIDGETQNIVPATPNNYYIPQHFDITNANLWEFESYMDKALWKARSIYVKLYDYKEWIWKSIKKYENTINNTESLKENKNKRFWCTIIILWILLMLVELVVIYILNEKNMVDEDSLSKIFNYVIFWSWGIIFLIWLIYNYHINKKDDFEKSKTAIKDKLLEVCDFLKDCYFSHRSDEKLAKLEEYKNNFNKGWNVMLKDNDKKLFVSKEKMPCIKELWDTYGQIREELEEWWKVAWWRSVFYEYNDKLWWDYDINMAKEKFSWDDEL